MKAEANRLVQQASEQFQKSQFEAALHSWQQALKIYQQIGARFEEANSLVGLGNVFFSLEQYQLAIDCYQQSLSIAQEIGNRSVAAVVLCRLSIVYNSIGERQQAIEYHQQGIYIELIELLLSCPNGAETEILNANRNLVDAGLVNAMEWEAEVLAERSDYQAADKLRNIAVQLTSAIGNSSEAIRIFFAALLQAIVDSDSASQVIYPLLEANQDKLNDNFIQLLQSVPAPPEEITTALISFSDIIQDFPLGSIAINLEIAIVCCEKVLDSLTLELSPINWASAQNTLASAYSNRIFGKRAENIERAIFCYQNALQIYTLQALAEDWAMVQNNLGNAYCKRICERRAENIERAIFCYQNALQVYTREPLPQDWAMTQNNLAAAYCERIFGERSENLEQAITCSQNALQVYTCEAFPEQWALTLNNLGLAYSQRLCGESVDNLEQVVTCFQKALRVYTREAFPQQWARTQNNLAVAYSNRLRGEHLENLEQAITCYQKTLQVYTREAFPEQRAMTLNNLGTVYRDRLSGEQAENLEQAINCYQNALQVYSPEAFPEGWARTQNNLAIAYMERIFGNSTENLEQAIACSQNALEVFTREAFPENHTIALFNLGYSYKKTRQFHNAYKVFASAINAVEFLRGKIVSGDRAKQRFFEKYIQTYSEMVEVCLKLSTTEPYYYAKAIEYVERGKARNLVELLATRDLYPKGEVPQYVLNELKHLRQEITIEQRRLELEERNRLGDISSHTEEKGQQPTSPPIALAPDRTRLNQLRQRLDNLITYEIGDPAFTLTQNVEPITLAEIQSLIDSHTAILEWHIGTNGFQTFILKKDSLEAVQFSKAELEKLTAWNQQYLQALFNDTASWKANLDQWLSSLSKILRLDEIISHAALANCNSLILVPHRYLHLFPLHALPLGSEEVINLIPCLLDRFPGGISYAPSCQLLELAQKRSRPDFSYLFAIQNPTGDLTYTDLEVKAIANHFRFTEVLVKQQAKKSAIDDQRLGTAHCAHFSCHGYFNLENPLLSALLLADCQVSPTPAQDNSLQYLHLKNGAVLDLSRCLTLADLFSKDLSACRLVTLSACETGLTDFTSLTDEYISLPSGFIYAGVPSVVSSLWRVDDLATALLMIKFYENLQRACRKAMQSEVPETRVRDGEGASSQTVSVARALNTAQIWLRDATTPELQAWTSHLKLSSELIKQIQKYLDWFNPDEQPFQDPMYWAAFCAIGQ